MKPSEIHYTTGNEVVKTYQQALTNAKGLVDLRGVAVEFGELFPDIVGPIEKMDSIDFVEWREGLKMERRGDFAGDIFMKKYGAILLPALALQASALSLEYGAPWGCAYIRLREVAEE